MKEQLITIQNKQFYVSPDGKIRPVDNRTEFKKFADSTWSNLKQLGKTIVSPDFLKYMVPGMSTYAIAQDGAKDLEDAYSAYKSKNYLDMIGRGIHALGNVGMGAASLFPIISAFPTLYRNTTAGITGLQKSRQLNKIANELNKSVKSTKLNTTPFDENVLAGKIGWSPAETISVTHASDNPMLKFEDFYPQRWDAQVHKASPYGLWVTEGEPGGFLQERPYVLESKATLKKPIVQIGEATGAGKNNTRNAIVQQDRKQGADAIKFQNIADNKATNQTVVFLSSPETQLPNQEITTKFLPKKTEM